ncbi:MAG TPA: sugar transferase [Gaiellaceae bacterium]|nr:sugar transferase [Gaiellaceae bacterium]
MSVVEQAIRVARPAVGATHRPRGWLLRRGLVGADIVGLVLAFSVVENIFGGITKGQTLSNRSEVGLFLLTLPVWILLAKLYGLYDRDETRTQHHTVDDLGGVFHLATVGTWVVVAGARISDFAHPYLVRVTVFWALAIAAIVITRSIVRRICRRHESFIQNTVIVGSGPEVQLITKRLQERPDFGLRVVGFTDAVEDLPRLVDELHVARVIVGFGSDGHEPMLAQIRELNARGVQVDVVPRFPELIGPEVDLHAAGGITLFSLRAFKLSRSSRALKRTGDVIASSIGLLLTLPLFAAAAVAIKLDSPGPVFFRQERIRDARRTFRMWKFRTMVADAEERKADVAHLNIHAQNGGSALMFKVDNDPRVTRVGRVLRRFSLDELPQLLNVLVGDMSVVGPRPLIPEEHSHVTEWRRRRLDVRPGMTGLWQVSGRSTVPFEEMVALDYRYVTNWSLLSDLSLVLQTLPQLARGRAATH